MRRDVSERRSDPAGNTVQNSAVAGRRAFTRAGRWQQRATAGRRRGVVAPTALPPGPGASTADLVRAAARVTIASLQPIADALRGTAGAFGAGDLKAGRHALAHDIARLRTLALACGMLTSTPGIHEAHRVSCETLVACVSRTLDQMEAASRRGDWAGIAGLIEGDLRPLLADWTGALETIGGRAPDAAAEVA